MSNHLPECDELHSEATANAGGWDYGWPCICPALRACEARFEAERRPIDVRATQLAVQHGFEQGVQAARDATAALTICNCDTDWESGEHQDWCVVPLVLAAIDALRGDA